MLDSGLTMYFRNNRMRFRYRTILELEKPEYVHLRINEQKKQMFIQRCEKDKDAFRLVYSVRKGIVEHSCYINARNFLLYLSKVVGVNDNSVSLHFPGILMNDGQTVYIDLTNYQPVRDEEADDE